jgi:hypothetical protein
MVIGSEQRSEARRVPRRPELLHIRVRAGLEGRMLDCTTRSVHVATLMRLLPGRKCSLSWPALDTVPSASGIVLRCNVGLIDPHLGVQYHAVIILDGAVPFLREAATQDG